MTNLSGKAQTVLGTAEPDALGFALMHEHLYLDLRPNHQPDAGSPASALAEWDAPLSLANLHLARRALPLQDNYVLDSESDAVSEISRFRALGGGTLVDVTSRGLGRDPAALARAARASGLNIIMGCGWYQKVFHPPEMDNRSVEDLAREIVEDITVGADGTGIRAGIIGEIGVNGDPITPNETKNIRAAARASAETGAAISFHAPQIVAEKHALLDIAEREGADLSRAIMGHSCGMAGDIPAMLDLLARGVCIEFDTLGVVRAGPEPSRDHLVANAIPMLIDEGYEDRILLSQDVCWKSHLNRFGGSGYTYIQETFLPHLATLGVDESARRRIMVENPKRALTFI